MFLKRLAGVSQQMGIYSCGTTADIDLIRHNYFLCSAENSKKGGKQGGLLVGFLGSIRYLNFNGPNQWTKTFRTF